MEKNIDKMVDRLRHLLLNSYGCTFAEAVMVCEKTKSVLDNQIEQIKKNNEEITKNNEKYDYQLEQLRNRIIKREEKCKTGYKITAFKKPLPPPGERKVYQRVCRRCDSIYRTVSKYSWFCDKCKMNSVSNQVHEKSKYQV